MTDRYQGTGSEHQTLQPLGLRSGRESPGEDSLHPRMGQATVAYVSAPTPFSISILNQGALPWMDKGVTVPSGWVLRSQARSPSPPTDSKAGSLPQHPPCRPSLSSGSALPCSHEKCMHSKPQLIPSKRTQCAPGALLLKVQGILGCECDWQSGCTWVHVNSEEGPWMASGYTPLQSVCTP